MIALGVSVLAHAGLLAVRFAAPDAFRQQPADPGLEVILVNAKHANAPSKADALAQASLEGGGTADAGRARSPLPDLRKIENGESIKALQRRIADLEQRQQNVLTQVSKSTFTAPPKTEQDKPDPTRLGADAFDTSRAISRAAAEVIERIEDQNKRPKRTQITPSTRQVGYALYYKEMQKRIEEVGTLNFPQQGGKKLYGELVVYIPIFQDGTIYTKDGGPRIERSSGNPALDAAALRIVRQAAPFGGFPANMRTRGKDDLWEVITRFRFTREETMQAELRGN
ncbi:TonB C-terminal domain-containing protein [Massilia sp. G4R7]|uniref:TonB C-terminal domain-containing protein n=1 Tax=Massilia phyllostachyos TaxID=2898585 RepID=A0ABS8Q3D4_9BURK|nr:TonB C-terminal domain-containing protein [Massilia phyllostachyos]MCD2515150.1 TonB C-terminal domain-containing protein [Massilia phyllostachyos]